MARAGRMIGMVDTGAKLEPKHLTKKEFAKRLQRLVKFEHHWSNAEFGRKCDIPKDAIGRYINAHSLPSRDFLKRMASVLHLEPEELLPNYLEVTIDDEESDFEMKQSPSVPGCMWVRLNRLVEMKTAVKIADLLENDNALAVRETHLAPNRK